MYRIFLTIGLVLAALLPVAARAQELPLGSALPLAGQAFAAADGSSKALSAYAGPAGTVLVFWANRCPWVDRYEARVTDLAARYGERYGFVLVGSAAADANAARAQTQGYRMPYVTDAGGALAAALGAQRTPQVFVFDAAGALAYTGTVDDSPSDPAAASKPYLRDALDAIAAGRPAPTTRTEALGCLIRTAAAQ